MNDLIVGFLSLGTGIAIVFFRHTLTRRAIELEKRTLGVRVGHGEPRVWFTVLAGLVCAAGGIFVIWSKLRLNQ